MKKNYYLRHDASASVNQKLMLLMEKEGAKGYGLYWLLLEALFRQPKMSAPLSLLGGLAYRFRTREPVLRRVIECYDLFEVADGVFRSPGLDKRMQPLIAVQEADDSPEIGPLNLDNSLKISSDSGDSARIAEKSRAENSNNSRKAEPAVVAAEDEIPPVAIRPWEALVDEMAADRSWMDMVGTHSGLGQLYIDRRDEVVDLFRQHIRLYDKGGGLLRVANVRQYFANYLAAGSRTCQGVRSKLLDTLRRRQTDAGVSPYETIVDGHRTYLGRPIPDDAPPRPDEYAVWNEQTHRWER